MALLGFPLAAGVPAAGEPGSCVPDHSWLSKTRTRLPHEVHVAVFDWVLGDSPWKTRISEPRENGFSRWRGGEAARRALTNNRVLDIAKPVGQIVVFHD